MTTRDPRQLLIAPAISCVLHDDEFPVSAAPSQQLGPTTVATLKQSRWKNYVILAALAPIALLTLIPDSQSSATGFNVCVICGAFGSANFILNIFLFIPLGAALYLSGTRFSRAVIFCAGATLTIEVLQLLVVTGREASLSDLLSNTTGGTIGWLLASSAPLLIWPDAVVARRLATAMAAVMLMLAGTGIWIFSPSPTQSRHYGQIAPRLGFADTVPGEVLQSAINDLPLPRGRLDEGLSSEIARRLAAGELALSAVVQLLERTERIAPVVRIADTEREEIGMLSVRRDSLVFTARTRAADFALGQPSVSLGPIGQCETCVPQQRVNPVAITGERRGFIYEVGAEWGQHSKRSVVLLTPNLAWAVLLPNTATLTSNHDFRTSTWLFVQALLLAYWAAFATPTGKNRTLTTLTVVVGAALTSQLILPLVVSAPRGPFADGLALLIGGLFGLASARVMMQLRASFTGRA